MIYLFKSSVKLLHHCQQDAEFGQLFSSVMMEIDEKIGIMSKITIKRLKNEYGRLHLHEHSEFINRNVD